jgi:hypothetical protein
LVEVIDPEQVEAEEGDHIDPHAYAKDMAATDDVTGRKSADLIDED